MQTISAACSTTAPSTAQEATNKDKPSAPDGVFTAVSSGYQHSCGLRTDGAIECWGLNNEGQSDAPGGNFVAVSGGGLHSCGLRSDSTVRCWGGNGFGQSDAPARTRFIAVSAGFSHTCGLRTDGIVQCWGRPARARTVGRAGQCPVQCCLRRRPAFVWTADWRHHRMLGTEH